MTAPTMTDLDVTALAKEAGMTIMVPAEDDLPAVWHGACTADLERFAALVLARSALPQQVVAAGIDSPQLDLVVEANRELLHQRSQVGIRKYGATLGDNNHSRKALLTHALEEALDLANYLQAELQRDARQPAPVKPDGLTAKPLPNGHREDYYLLANARRLAQYPISHIRSMSNWVLATELFATGSTSATEICRVAGIDPDGTTIHPRRHPGQTRSTQP